MESFGGKYFLFRCGLNGHRLVPLCHALHSPPLVLKQGVGRLRPASAPSSDATVVGLSSTDTAP